MKNYLFFTNTPTYLWLFNNLRQARNHSFSELLQIRNTSHRTSLRAKHKLHKHIFNLKIFLALLFVCFFFLQGRIKYYWKFSIYPQYQQRVQSGGVFGDLGTHQWPFQDIHTNMSYFIYKYSIKMEVQNLLSFFDVAAVHCTLLCAHPHNPTLSIFFQSKAHGLHLTGA